MKYVYFVKFHTVIETNHYSGLVSFNEKVTPESYGDFKDAVIETFLYYKGVGIIIDSISFLHEVEE